MKQPQLIDFFPFGIPPSLAFWVYESAPQANAAIGPCQCIATAHTWASKNKGFTLPLNECREECVALRQTRPQFPVLDHKYRWAGGWPVGGNLMTAVAAECLPETYKRFAGDPIAMMMGENIDWILLFLSRPSPSPPAPRKDQPKQQTLMDGKRVCNFEITLRRANEPSLTHDVFLSTIELLEVRYLNLIVAAIVRTVVRCWLHIQRYMESATEGLTDRDRGPLEGLTDFADEYDSKWTLGPIYWRAWVAHNGTKRVIARLGKDGYNVLGVTVKGEDGVCAVWYAERIISSVAPMEEVDTTSFGHTIARFSDSTRIINMVTFAPGPCDDDNNLRMHRSIDAATPTFTLRATWVPGHTPATEANHTAAEDILNSLFVPDRTYQFQKWYLGRFKAPREANVHQRSEDQRIRGSRTKPKPQTPNPNPQSEEEALVEYVVKHGGCYHVLYERENGEKKYDEYLLCGEAAGVVSTLYHYHAEACGKGCKKYVCTGKFNSTRISNLISKNSDSPSDTNSEISDSPSDPNSQISDSPSDSNSQISDSPSDSDNSMFVDLSDLSDIR